jgi:hypothetical protein
MNPIAAFARAIRPLLTLPLVRQTRRNHALEHATIHMLSRRVRVPMAGRSDQDGFVLLGEIDTPAVEAAARDALGRMQRGERQWAIHPNCGTNLVTTIALVSLGAYVGMLGADKRDRFARLPLVMVLTAAALFAGRPLGTEFQRHITTDGDPADTEIVGISKRTMRLPFTSPITVHRVKLRSS